MLVSIITPSYNAEKFIADTIESVLAQTYQNWEMIIVDDCSRDNSSTIIKQYSKKDSRIKPIFLETNQGAAIARNTAIKAASGKYIAFLDADDIWMSHKLEKQLQFMQTNNLSFTYSSYHTISEESKQTGTFTVPSKITYHSILRTCSVGCLTAIYNRDILGKTYMINASKGEDLALWLNIMKRIQTTQGITEPLAYYRIHNNTLSSNKLNAAKAQWNVYRNIEKLNLLQCSYYMLHYAYYGFMKYR